MKPIPPLFYTAWKKLIAAYLVTTMAGFGVGTLLVESGLVRPEILFGASTQRIASVVPLFEAGARAGIDLGVLLFVWNLLAALAALSFVYTAGLFNPDQMQTPPRRIRAIFCGTRKMKLLCYLPGCPAIGEESLRRVFVWTLIPLLGLLLLGIESGLQIAVITMRSGSFLAAVAAFLPHGVVEIPAFALAGAVSYAGHLMIQKSVLSDPPAMVFEQLDTYRRKFPASRIIVAAVAGLLLSGAIEAHITPVLMKKAGPPKSVSMVQGADSAANMLTNSR